MFIVMSFDEYIFLSGLSTHVIIIIVSEFYNSLCVVKLGARLQPTLFNCTDIVDTKRLFELTCKLNLLGQW